MCQTPDKTSTHYGPTTIKLFVVFSSLHQWPPRWAVAWPGNVLGVLRSLAPSRVQGQPASIPIPRMLNSATEKESEKKTVLVFADWFEFLFIN